MSALRARRIARRTTRRIERQLPGHEKRTARRRRRRRRLLLGAFVFGALWSLILLPALIGADSDSDAAAQQQAALVGALAVSDLPYAEAINQTVVMGIDPRLVAAVASVASGFDPGLGCASGARRQGIMQLAPDVAASYGVDACSPEVAIVSGAAHLTTLLAEHRDWAAALDAYGGGPVPIVPVGGGAGQGFSAAVLAQWEAYKAQFPGPGGGSGGPVGSGPGIPKGSTDSDIEPGLPPVTRRMLDEIIPMFGRGYATFCFGQRDGPSDHPSGHACDFVMSDPLGTMPTPDYLAHGWALCNYLIANADRLRVKYIIWQKRIWELGEWDEYNRYADGNLTEDHYDHVHLSMYRS